MAAVAHTGLRGPARVTLTTGQQPAACALDAAHCDDTTDNNIILIVFASSPEILFIDSHENINL